MSSGIKFKITSVFIRLSFGFLSILAIDLIVSFLLTYIIEIDFKIGSYLRTLVGMMTIMVLFYFFLDFIDKWTRRLLEKLRSSSQRYIGQYIGLVSIVSILFFLMFLGYHLLWFKKLPFELKNLF